jgi:hypothetical protein
LLGWLDELDELELVLPLGWLGGLLTLMVGPLGELGAVVEVVVGWAPKKYQASAMMTMTARMTPTITPAPALDPLSLGPEELI